MKQIAWILALAVVAVAQDKPKLDVSFEEKRLAIVPEDVQIGRFTFSPDGKTVAYYARKPAKWFVVVGEKKGEDFDGVRAPTFSPDGRKVAFGARKGREFWWKVVEVK